MVVLTVEINVCDVNICDVVPKKLWMVLHIAYRITNTVLT